MLRNIIILAVLAVILALAEEGRTMLLVTHELGFAYHVATRIIFLADGAIVSELREPTRDSVLATMAQLDGPA